MEYALKLLHHPGLRIGIIMTNSQIPLQSNSPNLTQDATLPATTIGVRRFLSSAWKLQERERARLREDIAQVPGLMAQLMMPRNGQKWTTAQRKDLREKLRRLPRLGLYLLTAAIPGTIVTLPLLAWWLDRRKRKRD